MNSNDQRIAAALDADDHAFLASLDSDRGMFQQIGDSWKGPLGGWAKLGFVFAIAIGLGLAYCIYRAVTAEGTDAILGWGLSSLALLIMQGFLKQWMFERVNMLTVLREVKRLQVQIAMLNEKDR
ncbi:MAG: DUF6768 family protein [Erythrobacter sp.]|jgi:hypothetical protein|uniref:DUF6768 family protein n=1 Tax=Porphyrobacter sp. MBR-155 TaxID=3156464 RepID=UPI00276B32C2|nr:hypothetical protein [Erythrobacter sp.]MDT8280049.1 DUF6768 family protein [Erythrobacter sp.]MDZ4274100.1 DUF6768 family protein [Erythrobacter sp.]